MTAPENKASDDDADNGSSAGRSDPPDVIRYHTQFPAVLRFEGDPNSYKIGQLIVHVQHLMKEYDRLHVDLQVLQGRVHDVETAQGHARVAESTRERMQSSAAASSEVKDRRWGLVIAILALVVGLYGVLSQVLRSSNTQAPPSGTAAPPAR